MLDILQQTNLTVGPLLASLLLGFTAIVLLLWYSAQKLTYWKKIGIPYDKPVLILGSILENMRKPLHEADLDRLNKFGRIYGYYEGNGALLSVGEPEILRNIFVKDFQAFTGGRDIATGDKITESMISFLNGEDWKRLRTIVTPIFTSGKIKRMMSIFEECSRTLIQNFKEAAEKGQPIEAKSIYAAFSMDVIASSAFSTKIDSLNDPNNAFVQNAKNVFSSTLNWRLIVFTLFPGFMKFFRIAILSPKAVKFFNDVVLQMIEERRRTGQTRNDFLQLLLDTAKEASQEGKLDLGEKDDITENYRKEENDQVFKQIKLTKKTLSHEELVAQCMTFFLAGYHTTASTLAFASYCLALNHEIQEKVIEELDDVLRKNNGELTHEAVQNMKYLDNVISETMRIYPPAIRLERRADKDYKLGDTGLTVPKGMIVTVPVYALHRDPEFFPDPEKFDPDRFIPEERVKRHQYAYLPFGAGPKNCIGMRFALKEMKVCLAYVLSNFRIKKCPQTKDPLDFHTGQGLLDPKDITLLLEVRKDTVKAL